MVANLYRVTYIEDIASETQEFTSFLERKNLRVRPVKPPLDLELNELIRDEPDLILIDHVLTGYRVRGKAVPYLGGTLATRIREVYHEYPLILITTKNRFRKYSEAVQLGAIDDVIFKDDIEANPRLMVLKLQGWIQGFERLRKIKARNWNSLTRKLGASEDESGKLRETFPLTPKRLFGGKIGEFGWSVPEVARWINRILFRYPGIFYDSLHSATILGIAETAFLRPNVQTLFRHAKYAGPFAGMASRWWRDRILAAAFLLIRKAGEEPVLAKSFSQAFEKVHHVRLEPSRCVVTGEEHADAVCYILRKPVLREKSLDYFPDDRPRVMERARVSFKAIRQSPEVREELLSAEGRELYRQIIKGACD